MRRLVQEVLILDGEGEPFDLEATRTTPGRDVTASGSSSPKSDPNVFRARFIKCVSALEDKYRSEPERPRRSATGW